VTFLKSYKDPIHDIDKLDELPNLGPGIKSKVKEYIDNNGKL